MNVKAYVVINNLVVIRKGIGIQARSTGDQDIERHYTVTKCRILLIGKSNWIFKMECSFLENNKVQVRLECITIQFPIVSRVYA